MKRILGVISVFLGGCLVVWIGYNYLVEMQPEAQGRNPLPAIIVSVLFIFGGIKMIRQKK